MIKVLVVEDSPVVQEFLLHILHSEPDIRVVGVAHNGEEAVEAVSRLKPDVITMDIHMPRMNGFDATRQIMETHPTPIVIVSGSSSTKEVSTTFHAMEAGAVAVMQRPAGIGDPHFEKTSQEFVQTVRLMSEVRVVRRWNRNRGKVAGDVTPLSVEAKVGPNFETAPVEIKMVAIGASTGGPLALQTILSLLSKDFRAPVVVVQHIAHGFIEGFVEWLSQSSRLPVQLASPRELLLPGRVYVAPDDAQLRVEKDLRISLRQDGPENGLRPSVSCLFRSVAEACGEKAVGILLTGMGKDGAEELKMMKTRGAITIAQDEESSVVFGMPGEAINLNAATYVLSPAKIAAALNGWSRREEGSRR